MAFKLFFLIAFVAYAQAGGPAAYSISALSGDHAYVGSSNEHTVKGLYGQNVISSYSKAVDSAHSSVRVSSSRQSNDILGGYHGGYAAPAVVGGYGVSKVVSPYAAAPALYGGYGHGYGKVVAPVTVSHGYSSPAYATSTYAAPYTSHAYASPAYASHGYASHAYAAPAYAAAPAVYGGYSGYGGYAHSHGLGHGLAKGYASKVVAPVSSVHGYAAPAVGYGSYGLAASPAVYGGYRHGYGVSKVVSPLSTVVSHGYGSAALGYAPKVVAPVSSVVSHGYSAPAVGYSKVISPYGVAAAPAVYGGNLGYGVSKFVAHSVAAPVYGAHSVAAPVYGGYGGYAGYGGYGGYGVSKVVSPVHAYGAVAPAFAAPVAAVKTVASPAFTASVVSPGVSYSW